MPRRNVERKGGVVELEHWMEAAGLSEYLPALIAERVTFDDIASLTTDDLRELGLPLGPRRRFLTAAARLDRDEPSDPYATPDAERRVMTVVFFDLVGSTALSEQLDPEEMRNLLAAYQDLVTEVVTRHGGYLAKYLGDGTLAYFGWPRATEDQTVRSVRAALDVVGVVPSLPVPHTEDPLAGRVGIATGQVVVGDVSGERGAIVGRTANLAARLEGEAESGGVVIDAATAELVRGSFDLDRLGTRRLKGIDGDIEIIAVRGAATAESRFVARNPSARSTPFVGRDTELALMHASWADASDGRGGVVLISGEAGIGKSRLVRELMDGLGDDVIVFSLQCSPEHRSTVLYPALRAIEIASGASEVRGRDERAARVRGHLVTWPNSSSTAIDAVVQLMGLTESSRAESDTTDHGDPALHRRELLGLLLARVAGVAERGPILVSIEDLHWADSTTIELVQRFAASIEDRSVLIVGTHRPEWPPPKLRSHRVIRLELAPLNDAAARSLASAAGADLDDDTLAEVVERCDGNPLFVEEYAALRSGPAGPKVASDVPLGLSASLTAQFDRLGPAKRLAQVAAVIGREFDARAVSALLGSAESGPALFEPLLRSGVVVRSDGPGDGYAFKHALLRDAAYESLLLQDRRQLHGDVADLLGEDDASPPESVARHLARADRWREATERWREAGARAISVGASAEAVANLTEALEALGNCPADRERDAVELDILLELAPASMVMRGYATDVAKRHYERAVELAERLGDDDSQFVALWGENYTMEVRAQFRQSEPFVERLLALDTRRLRPDLAIQINHAASTYYGGIGLVDVFVEHARRGVELYDTELHRSHRHLFGAHDPGVCGYGQTGMGLAMLGHPEAAVRTLRDGLALADRLGHPPSTALGLMFHTMTLVHLGDDAARPVAESAAAYCAVHEVIAIGMSVGICRLAVAGDAEQRFASLRTHVDAVRRRGSGGLFIPTFTCWAAEAAIEVGDPAWALDALGFVDDISDRFGDHSADVAASRLRGDALLALGRTDESLEAYEAGFTLGLSKANRLENLRIASVLVPELRRRGLIDRAAGVATAAVADIDRDSEHPLIRTVVDLAATDG